MPQGNSLERSSDYQLIQSLNDLRRDLVFDKIDANGALKQTETILFGKEVGQVLQNDYQRITELLSELRFISYQVDQKTSSLNKESVVSLKNKVQKYLDGDISKIEHKIVYLQRTGADLMVLEKVQRNINQIRTIASEIDARVKGWK